MDLENSILTLNNRCAEIRIPTRFSYHQFDNNYFEVVMGTEEQLRNEKPYCSIFTGNNLDCTKVLTIIYQVLSFSTGKL